MLTGRYGIFLLNIKEKGFKCIGDILLSEIKIDFRFKMEAINKNIYGKLFKNSRELLERLAP